MNRNPLYTIPLTFGERLVEGKIDDLVIPAKASGVGEAAIFVVHNESKPAHEEEESLRINGSMITSEGSYPATMEVVAAPRHMVSRIFEALGLETKPVAINVSVNEWA